MSAISNTWELENYYCGCIFSLSIGLGIVGFIIDAPMLLVASFKPEFQNFIYTLLYTHVILYIFIGMITVLIFIFTNIEKWSLKEKLDVITIYTLIFIYFYGVSVIGYVFNYDIGFPNFVVLLGIFTGIFCIAFNSIVICRGLYLFRKENEKERLNLEKKRTLEKITGAGASVF